MAIKGIVIDPGHGGADSGATGNGIIEKDLTLEISKYMYNRFKELGVPVKLTRDSDINLSPSVRPQTVLDQFGNSNDIIVVSNHINAGGGEGAEVIYALRNNDRLSKSILDEIGKSGQVIRKYYQKRLPSDTNKDYYYILRNTPNTQAIIVEYGFLDNYADSERLKNNYKVYAEAVVKAITDYIGYKYIPLADTNYYIVKKGDTLYSIANNYGISVNKLKEINGLNSNILMIGQVLYIDDSKIDNNNLDDNVYYTVKKGDSLYSIAKKYNMTVDDLLKINGLNSDLLSIGQVLKIDNGLKNSSSYYVKKGDTLWNIAKIFNVSVNDLKAINNKVNNDLYIGEKLIIPNSSISEVVNTFNYVVKSGDTLYSIAKKYNTSVNDIKSLNSLKTNILSIGQVLKIPN